MKRESETTPPPTTDERLQALEFLVGQLVLTLDAEPRMSSDSLAAWMALCQRRMRETASATPRQVAAIEAVSGRVLAASLGPAPTA